MRQHSTERGEDNPPPDTGASKNSDPAAVTISATFWLIAGSIVLESMQSVFGCMVLQSGSRGVIYCTLAQAAKRRA